MSIVPSPMDERHLALVRENVRAFMRRAAAEWVHGPGLMLDVAPQVHEGARPHFGPDVVIETLDIDPAADTTHHGDICTRNAGIADGSFDWVVCTEVLEHVLQPFAAAAEIRRMLAPGGLLLASVPFDLRIHGPLPDCWRFTEHGLRALLHDYEILSLEPLENPDRPLMPVHYTIVARRPERDRGRPGR
jgi:SAM-dependent methyltransferase